MATRNPTLDLSEWLITERRIPSDRNLVARNETIFTIGNGLLSLRGSRFGIGRDFPVPQIDSTASDEFLRSLTLLEEEDCGDAHGEPSPLDDYFASPRPTVRHGIGIGANTRRGAKDGPFRATYMNGVYEEILTQPIGDHTFASTSCQSECTLIAIPDFTIIDVFVDGERLNVFDYNYTQSKQASAAVTPAQGAQSEGKEGASHQQQQQKAAGAVGGAPQQQAAAAASGPAGEGNARNVTQYSRVLNLRTGELKTSFVFTSLNGHVVRIESSRLVSFCQKGVAAIRLSATLLSSKATEVMFVSRTLTPPKALNHLSIQNCVIDDDAIRGIHILETRTNNSRRDIVVACHEAGATSYPTKSSVIARGNSLPQIRRHNTPRGTIGLGLGDGGHGGGAGAGGGNPSHGQSGGGVFGTTPNTTGGNSGAVPSVLQGAGGAAGGGSSGHPKASVMEMAPKSFKVDNGVVSIASAYLGEGSSAVFEKIAAFASEGHYRRDDLVASARNDLLVAVAMGYDGLLVEQRDHLRGFWSDVDIKIAAPSMKELLPALRLSHLQLYMNAGQTRGTSIATKGMCPYYGGQYSWDTEIVISPYFTYNLPHISKNFIQFRIDTLPQAMDRALELGLGRGAVYPWRTINGNENWPAVGGTVPLHINADIAFAIRSYYEVTHDVDLILKGGAGLVVMATALTFIQWGTWSRGVFHIRNVTGPDEYNILVNDNYYTNIMAQHHLTYAVDIAETILMRDPPAWRHICEVLRMPNFEDDLERMKKAAEKMAFPYDATQRIHLQDASFLNKKGGYPLSQHANLNGTPRSLRRGGPSTATFASDGAGGVTTEATAASPPAANGGGGLLCGAGGGLSLLSTTMASPLPVAGVPHSGGAAAGMYSASSTCGFGSVTATCTAAGAGNTLHSSISSGTLSASCIPGAPSFAGPGGAMRLSSVVGGTPACATPQLGSATSAPQSPQQQQQQQPVSGILPSYFSAAKATIPTDYNHPVTIYRHRICKISDIILAQILFTDRFTKDEKLANFQFYEGLTTHDVSASWSTFSIMAAHLGLREKAYAYFRKSLMVDIDDIVGNASESQHIVSLAGSWACVVRGFGGMRVSDGHLHFNPWLPDGWTGYSFKVKFAKSTVVVSVSRCNVVYNLLVGTRLMVGHAGSTNVHLIKGKPVTIKLSKDIRSFDFDAVVVDLNSIVHNVEEDHFWAWKEVIDALLLEHRATQTAILRRRWLEYLREAEVAAREGQLGGAGQAASATTTAAAMVAAAGGAAFGSKASGLTLVSNDSLVDIGFASPTFGAMAGGSGSASSHAAALAAAAAAGVGSTSAFSVGSAGLGVGQHSSHGTAAGTSAASAHFISIADSVAYLRQQTDARNGFPFEFTKAPDTFTYEAYLAYIRNHPQLFGKQYNGLRTYLATVGRDEVVPSFPSSAMGLRIPALSTAAVDLPYGSPADAAGHTTLHAVANKKFEVFRHNIASRGGARVVTGALELIDDLRRNGIAVGCVSSSRNGEWLARQLGVGHLFDVFMDGKGVWSVPRESHVDAVAPVFTPFNNEGYTMAGPTTPTSKALDVPTSNGLAAPLIDLDGVRTAIRPMGERHHRDGHGHHHHHGHSGHHHGHGHSSHHGHGHASATHTHGGSTSALGDSGPRSSQGHHSSMAGSGGGGAGGMGTTSGSNPAVAAGGASGGGGGGAFPSVEPPVDLDASSLDCSMSGDESDDDGTGRKTMHQIEWLPDLKFFEKCAQLMDSPKSKTVIIIDSVRDVATAAFAEYALALCTNGDSGRQADMIEKGVLNLPKDLSQLTTDSIDQTLASKRATAGDALMRMTSAAAAAVAAQQQQFQRQQQQQQQQLLQAQYGQQQQQQPFQTYQQQQQSGAGANMYPLGHGMGMAMPSYQQYPHQQQQQHNAGHMGSVLGSSSVMPNGTIRPLLGGSGSGSQQHLFGFGGGANSGVNSPAFSTVRAGPLPLPTHQGEGAPNPPFFAGGNPLPPFHPNANPYQQQQPQQQQQQQKVPSRQGSPALKSPETQRFDVAGMTPAAGTTAPSLQQQQNQQLNIQEQLQAMPHAQLALQNWASPLPPHAGAATVAAQPLSMANPLFQQCTDPVTSQRPPLGASVPRMHVSVGPDSSVAKCRIAPDPTAVHPSAESLVTDLQQQLHQHSAHKAQQLTEQFAAEQRRKASQPLPSAPSQPQGQQPQGQGAEMGASGFVARQSTDSPSSTMSPAGPERQRTAVFAAPPPLQEASMEFPASMPDASSVAPAARQGSNGRQGQSQLGWGASAAVRPTARAPTTPLTSPAPSVGAATARPSLTNSTAAGFGGFFGIQQVASANTSASTNAAAAPSTSSNAVAFPHSVAEGALAGPSAPFAGGGGGFMDAGNTFSGLGIAPDSPSGSLFARHGNPLLSDSAAADAFPRGGSVALSPAAPMGLFQTMAFSSGPLAADPNARGSTIFGAGTGAGFGVAPNFFAGGADPMVSTSATFVAAAARGSPPPPVGPTVATPFTVTHATNPLGVHHQRTTSSPSGGSTAALAGPMPPAVGSQSKGLNATNAAAATFQNAGKMRQVSAPTATAPPTAAVPHRWDSSDVFGDQQIGGGLPPRARPRQTGLPPMSFGFPASVPGLNATVPQQPTTALGTGAPSFGAPFGVADFTSAMAMPQPASMAAPFAVVDPAAVAQFPPLGFGNGARAGGFGVYPNANSSVANPLFAPQGGIGESSGAVQRQDSFCDVMQPVTPFAVVSESPPPFSTAAPMGLHGGGGLKRTNNTAAMPMMSFCSPAFASGPFQSNAPPPTAMGMGALHSIGLADPRQPQGAALTNAGNVGGRRGQVVDVPPAPHTSVGGGAPLDNASSSRRPQEAPEASSFAFPSSMPFAEYDM